MHSHDDASLQTTYVRGETVCVFDLQHQVERVNIDMMTSADSLGFEASTVGPPEVARTESNHLFERLLHV